MTLSWPLPTAEFFDALRVRQVTFRLGDTRTMSTTRAGEVIPHQIGARLWQGEAQLGLMRHGDRAGVEAILSLLEQQGASFLIYDRRKPHPTGDPGSAALTGTAVTLASLNANHQEIALDGLPAGYVISRGDLLAFTYGSSPTRYGLHRVVGTAAADGTGLTPEFQVIPAIRPGATVGAAVTLTRPVCKAVLTEADYGMGRAIVSPGGSFRWQQTLR